MSGRSRRSVDFKSPLNVNTGMNRYVGSVNHYNFSHTRSDLLPSEGNLILVPQITRSVTCIQIKWCDGRMCLNTFLVLSQGGGVTHALVTDYLLNDGIKLKKTAAGMANSRFISVIAPVFSRSSPVNNLLRITPKPC